MNEFEIADVGIFAVILLGVVFIAIPTVLFLIWVFIQYIKFWIEQHTKGGQDD